MKGYWIETAVVGSAAVLTGFSLYDNYAELGAMMRYSGRELEGIANTEGIKDVAKKAESFRFGARCGKAIGVHTAHYNEEDILAIEAHLARFFFAPEPDGSVSVEDYKHTLHILLEAMVKRTQIRTHTAKPGYEDINVWLAQYDRMRKDYVTCLPRIVDAIVTPVPAARQLGESFFSTEDALVRLAVSGQPVLPDALRAAMKAKPVCVFGKILQELCH